MRVNTSRTAPSDRPAAAPSTFGLSPRVPSSIRSGQQHFAPSASTSSSSLSSHSHPRTHASPRLPHNYNQSHQSQQSTDSYASALAYQQSHNNNQQQNQHSHHQHNNSSSVSPSQSEQDLSSLYYSTAEPKRRGGAGQHQENGYSNGNGNGHANGYNHNNHSTRSVYPTHPSSHTNIDPDSDNPELLLWKQQQKLLDAQHRNFSLLKYGFLTTLTLMVCLVVYLVLGGNGGSKVAFDLPKYTVSQLNTQTDDPSVISSVGVAPPATPEVKSYDALDLSASELENHRRLISELTRTQAERERDSLYELDPSAKNVVIDHTRPDMQAMNPVLRATKVIPQPGVETDVYSSSQSVGAAGILDETVLDASRYSSVRDATDEDTSSSFTQEDTSDILRAVAEKQAAAHSRNEEEEERGREEKVGVDEERHRHGGSSHDGDDDHSHSHLPSASPTSHILIEQLIHEHTPAGAEPRTHSHKDHPAVPKYGKGARELGMPEKEEGKANKKSTAPSSPAAATEEEVKHGRKKEVASSSSSKSTPPAPSTKKVDHNDDDLLSLLSEASVPSSDIALDVTKVGANSAAAQAHAAATEKTAEKSEATQTPSSSSDQTSSQSKPHHRLDSATRKASAALWAGLRGGNLKDLVKWPVDTTPVTSTTSAGATGAAAAGSAASTSTSPEHHYLFDDSVQFLILTSLKNQALARKIKTLYSPLIKRMTFVSDSKDTGLNATVLSNPHPDWSVASQKEQPWKVYELLKMLLDPKRAPHGQPAKFYFVMHDITFPLLDQIKWRLETYLETYHGVYPNFIGGRKTAHVFDEKKEQVYWKEQSDAGKRVFEGKKLFVVPSYIYGFDHDFLTAVVDFTSADSCPLLTTEGLGLAGLVECAGGVLEQTEYDFLLQTRSNHREKQLTLTSELNQWRTYDAYNGCNTPGMLQEAYDAYYGKLKQK